MIIYESTKDHFQADVINQSIAEKIHDQFKAHLGHATTKAEIRSWEESMRFMGYVLMDKEIPDNAGVAIEFRIPYTSKRIDFIISGKNEEKANTAVIIELKQWERADIVSGKDAIVSTYVGGRVREVSHPSYQAWAYATHIQDYNENVQNKHVLIKPCAFLHNYDKTMPDTITSPVYSYYTEKAPVFIKHEIPKLSSFIKRFIKEGDDRETLMLIENGKLRPSKSLQDALVNMLRGNTEFIMIDDQKVVYEEALKSARDSKADHKKRVLIVVGGPGTGKSVVAINLLVNLINQDMMCCYVSKNAAPRNVYAAKLSGELRKNRINNLFIGSGAFVDADRDFFDALIVDESHRLNAKSGIFRNKGENQIKEIIRSGKFSVFFIDESQRIDIHDIGSVEEILKWADEFGAETEILELQSQFRCNGSDGYIAWLDDVLGIRETANDVGFDLDYDIRVFDDLNDMREMIEEKNKEDNKARILAGYCWNWVSKKDNYAYDIVFDSLDFRMQWNFANSATYAIDPDSVNQVGCIHTSQGLEFDYVGVIVGDDLRFEEGKVRTDFTKRAMTDKSLSGIKTIARHDRNRADGIADEIIKNTYRTLMTRGQKGCFIYCTNKELGEYLKDRVGQNSI